MHSISLQQNRIPVILVHSGVIQSRLWYHSYSVPYIPVSHTVLGCSLSCFFIVYGHILLNRIPPTATSLRDSMDTLQIRFIVFVVSVVVEFYPWCDFYFILFYIHYHIFA